MGDVVIQDSQHKTTGMLIMRCSLNINISESVQDHQTDEVIITSSSTSTATKGTSNTLMVTYRIVGNFG